MELKGSIFITTSELFVGNSVPQHCTEMSLAVLSLLHTEVTQ